MESSYEFDEELSEKDEDLELREYKFDRIKVNIFRGESARVEILRGGGIRYIFYNADDGYQEIFERVKNVYFPPNRTTLLGRPSQYRFKLLDFQKREIEDDGTFNIKLYLDSNGLYRFHTLFYLQLMRANDESDLEENFYSDDDQEITLPVREVRMTSTSTPSTTTHYGRTTRQTAHASTYKTSSSTQTSRLKRKRVITVESSSTDSEADSACFSARTASSSIHSSQSSSSSLSSFCSAKKFTYSLRRYIKARELKGNSNKSQSKRLRADLSQVRHEIEYIDLTTEIDTEDEADNEKDQKSSNKEAEKEELTEFLLLENMFKLEKPICKSLITKMKNDVITEFEKYGNLLHMEVQSAFPNFKIYVKCESVNMALEVYEDLNGKLYEANQIRVTIMSFEDYVRLFPKALTSDQPLLKPFKI